MDENIFYQKKQVNISFQSSADTFFLFPTVFFHRFFFLIKKKNCGQFFSNLLQNEPKKAILHLKNRTNKKKQMFIHRFFFLV